MELIKMQIACLCFIGYLGIYYQLSKKVNTYSSKIYSIIIYACIINLILDMVSVLTVNHLESISPLFNDIITKLFIISINTLLWVVCLYLVNIEKKNREIYKWERIGMAFPLIISILICFTDKIYYHIDEHSAYSYGPIAVTCYICMGIYVGIMFWYMIHHWSEMPVNIRRMNMQCIGIILVIGIMQILRPQILISGLAGAMCTFNIFISAENPNMFLEGQFNYFNNYALSTVISDKINTKKSFNLVVMVLEDIEDIGEEYGQRVKSKLYAAIEKEIQGINKEGLYLYAPNVLVSLISREDNIGDMAKQIEAMFKKVWRIEGKDISIKAQIEYIMIPNNIQSAEKVIMQIAELQTKFKNKKIYMDKLLEIQNRNAFERDMEVITPNRYYYDVLCYMIIDVNNLKKINDQYGHLAGDQLLKHCIAILRKALAGKGTIYRLGGDEFGILLSDLTNGEISELLKNIEEVRIEMNRGQQHPVSFAIGYAFFNANRDESLQDMIKRADKMMYQNKFAMKKEK